MLLLLTKQKVARATPQEPTLGASAIVQLFCKKTKGVALAEG